MRVSLIKGDFIKDLILPSELTGSFWLSDYDANGNEENILNIEATREGWKAISNNDIFFIVNNKKVEEILLKEYNFYLLKDRQDDSYILIYCSPINDPNFSLFSINSIIDGFTIGNDSRNDIVYSSDFVAPFQARISLLGLEDNNDPNSNNKLIIKVEDDKYNIHASKWGVYVNNKRVHDYKVLENNDLIFVSGLKVMISKIGNRHICVVNNPNGQVYTNRLTPVGFDDRGPNENFVEDDEEIEMNLYNAEDYFYKKPRFVNKIEQLTISVDEPPTKQEEQDQSLLLTIGPMLTMSMTSLVMGYSAVSGVVSGNGTWSNAIPSIVMCVAMFASVFFWPVLLKRYENKKRIKGEKERQVKYNKYIESKRKVIQDEVVRQEKVLKYSFPTTKECQEIIKTRNDRLWERRIDDDDFLKVCLGIGSQNMDINIQYPEDHFTMAEDNLKDMVSKLGSEPKILKNVPIELSLVEYHLLAIVGEAKNNSNLMSQLLLQILALHSYDDLKVVIMTNKEKESNWEPFKTIPHLFSDDRSIRFFGSVAEEHKEICYHLEQVYLSRKGNGDDAPAPTNVSPHYLIITDSYKTVRSFEVIKKLLDEKDSLGFSLVILNDNVSSLPDQCQTFINSGEEKCDIFKSLLNDKNQVFTIDNTTFYDYNLCSRILSNIPIEIDRNKSGKLPDKIGFLEMFDALKIEQLNIQNRWQRNEPVLSLAAPVGVGRDGEKISLDLHEKYHGPHGLIAGMTGSGKSEFIITYILSMAINYHPYEVQFILIDYKGGGLAGAFENKASGLKLPHLVGTITNLDSVEIKRSFASIESELKRRQAAFNKARELSGESTIDIYKYQKMYRNGQISEPVSHLFIICDEFAELKTQEPDFMDQLISTARIGRSLGVHLILATQKPSGVVDPQIWSNTRFRVCLRVQEKSDSSEVIQCPDAAFLKQTGRFYFQVGFNEIFELGQAAWAGGPYIPSDKIRKNLDTSIDFVNNLGYIYKTVESKKKTDVVVANNGEELTNIVSFVSDLAKKSNISCTPLWLERIPETIFVDNLIKKYNYQKEMFVINPVIGEYDNPNMQKQHLLTMPLSKEGNALVFGNAGSGKENMITTLIYSSMLTYGPEEVNYYILDFGSEALRMFSKSPIVGDVLTNADEEKIENLFKMLYSTIEQRKKLFVNFGGDYTIYSKQSDKKLPAIVVVINNYETFQELEEAFDEDLIAITRDCVKYGIYFIITVTTPNGIRFKLRQNFNQEFVLNQNNEDDYSTILGNVNKVYPSKLFGRGIIKTDSVYEFQTALVTEKDKINAFIINLCNQMLSKAKYKASTIKVLPDVVEFKDVQQAIGIPGELVVGINKNTLAPETISYTKDCSNIITSMDISLGFKLIKPIINQLLYQKKSVVFINAEDYTIDEKYNNYIKYYDSGFDAAFEEIKTFVSTNYDLYVNSGYNKKNANLSESRVVLINGFASFKNKLSDENKNLFDEVIKNAGEIGVLNLIIIDGIDNVRKFEVDSWYKSTVNSNNGIWIGDGINDQYSLKVVQKTKDVKLSIDDDFCFVLKRGKPILVKMLEEFDIQL